MPNPKTGDRPQGSGDEFIRIGEMDVKPACVEGQKNDVFSMATFTFVKPKWIDDNAVKECKICSQPFTQLRRRHHCRFCGQVLCSKCCFQKVTMPQLGYNTAERVCEGCMPIAIPIKNTFASNTVEKLEAVRVLVSQLSNPDGIRQLLEAGGLHILIHLLRTKDANLWCAVCMGLAQLCTCVPVQPLVIKLSAIGAFKSWPLSGESCPDEVKTHCIGIINMLCQTPATRMQAINEGVLDKILPLCINGCGKDVILGLGTLSILVEEPYTHDKLISGDAVVISRILSYVFSADMQIQEISLKILGTLSLGDDHVKQRLVELEKNAGKCMLRILQSPPNNVQVLCNAVCAVSNLAASHTVQNSLAEYLPPLCILMNVHPDHRELMGHVVRGMANFAANSVHGPFLMTYLSQVMMRYLKSGHCELRYQGLKLVLRLASHSLQDTSVFYREDVLEILRVLAEKKDVMTAMDSALNKTVPEQVKPS